jgi:hypothetical protein
MSADVKAAVRPPSGMRWDPMRFAIGTALAISLTAGGFAIGRASFDQPGTVVSGGTVAAGADHAEAGAIAAPRISPTQPSDAAIRDQQRHHGSRHRASPADPEQALKDCVLHRHVGC